MIHAGTLEIEVGGQINANTFGPGDGGTITVDANSLVIGSGGIINAGTSGAGDAGAIAIQAESVRIGPGRAAINVGSSRPSDAPPDFVAGNAGTIDVVATDSIFLTNEGGEHHSLLESLEGCLFTGIFSATVEGGDSGSITLSAPQIMVTDGSLIATSTVGGGNAGTVLLRGNRILVANGGSVDSTSLPHPGSLRPSGDAGSVELVATGSIEVVGRTPEFGASRVSSLSVGSGAAGHVALTAPRIVVDPGAVATTAVPSGDSEGTRGGDITLDPQVVVLQNGSRIVADAGAGSGGNIQITADNYFAFPGTVVDASSELGVDGIVEVHAPDVDLAGKITALPSTPLDAASLMKEPCAARRSGKRAGSFSVRGNGGIPAEPDGWLPASVAFDARSGATTPTPQSAPVLASGSCK